MSSDWLLPGIDPSRVHCDKPWITVTSVRATSPADVNFGDPWHDLVTVRFSSPIFGGTATNEWQYRRDGREFWGNPLPPKLYLKKGSTMTTPKTKKVAAVEAPFNLFRSLSAVFLVNAAAFGKASVNEQTEVMTKIGNKPVLFVDSFATLSNARRLRDRLLAGEDVSMELEFNGIVLSPTELAALTAVRPILERITGMKGAYPWLPEANDRKVKDAGVVFTGPSIFNVNGHSISTASGKAIFEKATKYWSGGKKPSEFQKMLGGRYRYVTVGANYVDVGCQHVERDVAEAIARHYGWEPVVFEGA